MESSDAILIFSYHNKGFLFAWMIYLFDAELCFSGWDTGVFFVMYDTHDDQSRQDFLSTM